MDFCFCFPFIISSWNFRTSWILLKSFTFILIFSFFIIEKDVSMNYELLNCLCVSVYRASFRQTFAEFNAHTGEWKAITTMVLLGITVSIWITFFIRKIGQFWRFGLFRWTFTTDQLLLIHLRYVSVFPFIWITSMPHGYIFCWMLILFTPKT